MIRTLRLNYPHDANTNNFVGNTRLILRRANAGYESLIAAPRYCRGCPQPHSRVDKKDRIVTVGFV